MKERILHYGVREQERSLNLAEIAAEEIRLSGYAIVDAGYAESRLPDFSAAFDRALSTMCDHHGGEAALHAIGEGDTIRALLSYEPILLDLASNPTVLAICRCLMGEYNVLNQQNGVINPPGERRYSQDAYHRDLPYQYFVSTRPISVGALFCLDAFREENGATWVVPATHKSGSFPSDEVVASQCRKICAKVGAFILFDSMLFHRGGSNHTPAPRRGVNHVYTIPPIRQQIDLPAMVGPSFSDDLELRKLLGYDITTPRTVEELYRCRREKRAPSAPSKQ